MESAVTKHYTLFVLPLRSTLLRLNVKAVKLITASTISDRRESRVALFGDGVSFLAYFCSFGRKT